MTGSPTVRRRRLSAELVKLRENAKLTIDQVTKSLNWSRARLTYMETNKWTRPDITNIRALLDLYGVKDEAVREAIITLAKESRQKGWWADYQDVFSGSLPGFEAGASTIRTYEAILIPGLLQTADYAAEIFRGGESVEDSVVARRVKARMTRQQVLDREHPPHLWAVIDEAALRKLVGGPDVMAEQLRHIVDMSRRPNITVQVLRDSVGAHAAMLGSFLILDFASNDDGSIVYKEGVTEQLYLEREEEVHEYGRVHSLAMTAALPPDESATYLMSLVDELTVNRK